MNRWTLGGEPIPMDAVVDDSFRHHVYESLVLEVLQQRSSNRDDPWRWYIPTGSGQGDKASTRW